MTRPLFSSYLAFTKQKRVMVTTIKKNCIEKWLWRIKMYTNKSSRDNKN